MCNLSCVNLFRIPKKDIGFDIGFGPKTSLGRYSYEWPTAFNCNINISFIPLSRLWEDSRELNENSYAQLQFLLCESCFWCASYLYIEKTVDTCPACNCGSLESMPISSNESYKFNCDTKLGVILEFESNE